MPPDTGQIAARALQQIGTPFKLHGRSPGAALDCVGLVAYAVNLDIPLQSIPRDYHIKGEFLERIKSYLEQNGFEKLSHIDDFRPGDVILARPGARQLHLMVKTEQGFVHAHAGLRRVVMTPDPSPWPLAAGWRLSGG